MRGEFECLWSGQIPGRPSRVLGLKPALAVLMDQARGLMRTEDAEEGVRSFVERRQAAFKGR